MPKPITFPIELDLDRVKVVYPQADSSIVVSYDNGSDYDLGGLAAQRFLVAWAAAIAPEITTEPTIPASGAYTWPSKPVRDDSAIIEKLEQILFTLLGLQDAHPWRPVESADHGDELPW